jgi:riboflavin synthase
MPTGRLDLRCILSVGICSWRCSWNIQSHLLFIPFTRDGDAMFTGLVESKVPLVQSIDQGPARRMVFDLGRLAESGPTSVALGDSIALSGCCLTVVEIEGTKCHFELGSETLSKTKFGGLTLGQSVNCERSLCVGDRLGGHFVTGHIDGLGQVSAIKQEGQWRFYEFHAPVGLLGQMAPKGSITVDGVSLTLVQADDRHFSVALIPHTLDVTTLGELKVGDRVHLETDILAKYIARRIESVALARNS